MDTVHRVGPKTKDKSRQVIIQFCMRKYRDEFWNSIKASDVCKLRGVKFSEDLSKGDREARAALWPRISEARAAGKKAYYHGPYGYKEGDRIVKDGGLHQSFIFTLFVDEVLVGYLAMFLLLSEISLQCSVGEKRYFVFYRAQLHLTHLTVRLFLFHIYFYSFIYFIFVGLC